MALQFIESFDGYGNNEFPLRWTGAFGATIYANGRNGKAAAVGSGGSLSKTVNYNANWVVGFAVYMSVNFPSASELYGAQTPGSPNPLVKIAVETDGSVSVYSSGGLIANTGNALNTHVNTWYYFELKYELTGLSNVSVQIQLRVNKQTVLTGSGTTGWNASINGLTGMAVINQHIFGGPSVPGAHIFDDIYIFNQDGGVNNDFAGDIKILVIKPDQDLLTPFSKIGGSGTSYSCINEVPPDYDTSYLYDNTNNDFENFNWQQLPSFYGNVICVQYTIFARKDDEGSRAFQHTMASGPGSLSSAHYVGDSYLYFMWELDTGPGGASWTVALFNSTSFGFYIFTIPIPS